MHKVLFVEDMGPEPWRLRCAAFSAGTRSVLHLRHQYFRTKIISPICLYSILHNLLRASATQTPSDNKSMWTRMEPQILGPFVICGTQTPIHSRGGCTSDLLCAHNVPWALSMESKYCIFPIKQTNKKKHSNVFAWFFFPFLLFQGSHSEDKTMTIPLGRRHQITFCSILLKYKTKP